MGRYLTLSLFLEISYAPNAIYTLKDVDYEYNGKMYYSLKKLYLETGDPTEYKFANQFLAGWDHWQKIINNKQLLSYIESWRVELEIKLRSDGVMAVRQHARSHNPTAWQAAKWLADKGWDVRGVGRPSKEEVDREVKIKAGVVSQFDEDSERLKLIR